MPERGGGEPRLTNRASLSRLMRAAAPQLGVLALLHFIELMLWPLLVFFITVTWLLGIQLIIGVLARGARLVLHQRARARLRSVFMVRAAEDALARLSNAEADSDSAFWGAHILEYAACKDVPALAGAVACVLATLVLASWRLGVGVASQIGFVLGASVFAGALASRRRRGAVEAIVDRRRQLALWMAAATRDAGEIRSPRAVSRFLAAIGSRALAWSGAEDGVEDRRALHQSVIVAFTLAALFLVARELHVTTWSGLRSESVDSLSSIFMLGALIPAAYSLVSHLESLNISRTELIRLSPKDRVLTTPGTLKLERRPCTLRLTQVSVQYGEQLALSIDELVLDLSRPLVITGPNGAGKTTLAALIAGITTPTTGTLELDGVAPHLLTPDSIAFVPQDPVLIEALTVLENLRLVAPDCAREEARAALRRLGMNRAETSLDATAGSFSRGERRRIAIVRALLKRPWLLVLDEPDAWLDTAGRAELCDALLELSKVCAVVVVSHRSDVMTRFGAVVALSAAHHVEASGELEEVLPNSATQRGADVNQSAALAGPAAGTSSA